MELAWLYFRASARGEHEPVQTSAPSPEADECLEDEAVVESVPEEKLDSPSSPDGGAWLSRRSK